MAGLREADGPGVGSSPLAPDDLLRAQPSMSQLPIFQVEPVSMQFSVAADFVAAQVADNVLVLAVKSGKILRIDLDNPQDIDDIDLPRKPSETGIIRRMFLDPTASHLLITTTLADTYYVHTQSKQPKLLSKLKGYSIESVGWNPSQPTASTREILLGAGDGNVYETYIENTTDFYRREEKYLKRVYVAEGNRPVVGIWVDMPQGSADVRRVMLATPNRLLHFVGRMGRHGHEGSGSVYARLFDAESPTVKEVASDRTVPSTFAVTPESPEAPGAQNSKPERIFAWLHAEGISHGKLLTAPAPSDLGSRQFSQSTTLQRPPSGRGAFLALTQWHILQLFDNRIVATSQLDGSVVFDEPVLDSSQKPIALLADLKKNTFWLFGSKGLFEVIVTDEDRDVWKVMLREQRFEEALQYANNSAQKTAIATASGDFFMQKGRYVEAAAAYGKSSKPFEEVALALIDQGQKDALRQYLLAKLTSLKKSAVMQRMMLTSWLTELFMTKLNGLDDMVMTQAELAEDKTPADIQTQLQSVRREYQDFVTRNRADLDPKTVYDIISSHGRETELLYFSAAVEDYNYILAYWVQRENWTEALKALNKHADPLIIYKYSSVLMAHSATDFVDILMRQSSLDARKLIPAFLNYNQLRKDLPLAQNQAVRYLSFEIEHRGSSDTATHNTLLSIYASHRTADESKLLAYLETQKPLPSSSSSSASAGGRKSATSSLPYDADFALRLCLQHSRVGACALIYTNMGQYAAAVALALQHQRTDLAIAVAELPGHATALRKKLWLAIARAVIASPSTLPDLADGKPAAPPDAQPKGLAHKSAGQDAQAAGVRTALALLQRAPPDTLRIEDLLPLFPDFVRIDAFKDVVCAALEASASSIDGLKADMDASAATAARIAADMAGLRGRWALVAPGDSCALCRLPLLERRFWVWGCGHAAHGDCALARLGAADDGIELGGAAPAAGARGRVVARRVREARKLLELGAEGRRRDEARAELDEIAGAECLLCGEGAIASIDAPFVTAKSERAAWAL